MKGYYKFHNNKQTILSSGWIIKEEKEQNWEVRDHHILSHLKTVDEEKHKRLKLLKFLPFNPEPCHFTI